ncbi:hypothetical protein [Gluconobacter wancherniae]|uniref:Uncharacterized protein n=1 Tax=Gluconobacter wancherniae NBRC 103581 TaxID=656744 RepID=A0A511AZI8_9PROT|nr:hypothetical protein [Gluconobacter wancherniae]MBF0852918.1 hypothetical protein [Gluconobacter wancherniae]MBS1061737.1 hypothetical protein [Gluconobacter wancherniae]MBS1087805.1 hypothetical protein [Gluconobacter wancherniae]MBS1093487.1 hypothetical protein [Gluconobacter wancherniae]GBD56366.1 hypothetical protein NBRC103581_00941 [Gluconobacter wancherniae NBRC 103581]
MDIQTIEQTYNQLQSQSQQTAQALQALGSKMQNAAQSGDMQAREWSLDLRELALAIQAEQQQVATLLQQIHGAMMNADQGQQQNYAPQQNYVQEAPPPVQVQSSSGGFLSSVLNSGFAHSVAAGAGFGIGDDLIKEIF